jgi:hypothetical protein
MEIQAQSVPGSQPSRRPQDERGIDLTKTNREGIERVVIERRASRATETRDVGSDVRKLREDVLDTSGEETREARKDDAAHTDRIELSHEARTLLARQSAQKADDADRAARVEELRKRYLEGSLDTPARIERAAGRILGE